MFLSLCHYTAALAMDADAEPLRVFEGQSGFTFSFPERWVKAIDRPGEEKKSATLALVGRRRCRLNTSG